MKVFVVGWHPAPDSGDDGGFEWRYSRVEAMRELVSLVVLEAAHDGPQHNIVFATLNVPFQVDYDRPRTYDDLEPEITAWIDENLHLIDSPREQARAGRARRHALPPGRTAMRTYVDEDGAYVHIEDLSAVLKRLAPYYEGQAELAFKVLAGALDQAKDMAMRDAVAKLMRR